MPLAFVEFKKPHNKEGVLAERRRINNRFKQKHFRKFANITQLMVFSNNMEYRAELLFIRFPKLRQAYDLGIALGDIFTKCKDKTLAFTKLGLWHNKVENAGIISFESVAKSIAVHHPEILHYFDNRSTNASAESPNFG